MVPPGPRHREHPDRVEGTGLLQTLARRQIVVTVPYEPSAGSSRARTKSGTLRKVAIRWRDGLAWSARLQLLDSRLALEPPYDVTVHGYVRLCDSEGMPDLRDWLESIASALSDALRVDPTQIHLKPGRVGYTVPFSPPHFEIIITGTGAAPPPAPRVTCPSCGDQWLLGTAEQDDRCPRCDHQGAGLPFALGLL